MFRRSLHIGRGGGGGRLDIEVEVTVNIRDIRFVPGDGLQQDSPNRNAGGGGDSQEVGGGGSKGGDGGNCLQQGKPTTSRTL